MNIKVLLLILVLFGIGAGLVVNIRSDADRFQDSSRPSGAVLPKEKKPNDKVILVKGASYDAVKQKAEEFLNIVNQTHTQTAIELRKVSVGDVALMLPYNMRFATFGYLVNYLSDPGINYKPQITAWMSADAGDQWTRPEMVNKFLMITPAAPGEKMVYVTTHDNIGFKIGFAFKSQTEKLAQPPQRYRKPEMRMDELKMTSGEEIH